jgi:hypothetical protein
MSKRNQAQRKKTLLRDLPERQLLNRDVKHLRASLQLLKQSIQKMEEDPTKKTENTVWQMLEEITQELPIKYLVNLPEILNLNNIKIGIQTGIDVYKTGKQLYQASRHLINFLQQEL